MNVLEGPNNIDKDPQNAEKQSDKEVLKQTKDTLRYLWNDVKNRLDAGVNVAKENFSKSLQSLDKWLSGEKGKNIADISHDLTGLHDDIVSHPQSPLDRPSRVEGEIAQRATGLQNHILDGAAHDKDFLASSIGRLMRYIMQTER